MRKSLLLGLLGVALVAASMFPLAKSDAARTPQRGGTLFGRAKPTPLPNYDIRLEGRGEFTDVNISPAASKHAAVRTADAETQAHISAVDAFRTRLGTDAARNLRAEVNEAGALKNFFAEGATLSEPQADVPDNIARNFLRGQASLFKLSDSAVDELKLEKEDNDRGTTFLDYAQTVGGIKVFEGNVKVVINSQGEVLSVREGFLVTNPRLRLKPTLDEAEGIAKAFEHAGRDVIAQFTEMRVRQSARCKSRRCALRIERRARQQNGAARVARLR